MKNLFIVSLALTILLFSNHIFADEQPEDPCKYVENLGGYSTHFLNVNEDDIKKLTEYCQIYFGIMNKEPDYINKALNPMIERSSGLAFLKDIDFKIKTFEANGSENGLGFSYNYHKTNELTEYKFDADKNLTTGMSWVFSAKGNVAFDSEINPADFLDTRISISGFRDYGGVSKFATDSTFQVFNDLEDAATKLNGEELRKNRQQVKAIVKSFFSTQKYIEYDLNVGLESNQRFTQKQWTYGAKVALDIKSYGKNSQLGMWNILDYPFAFFRVLSGYDKSKGFFPLGSTFPTFVVGLDQIDPIDNDPREAVGEESNFERIKGEIYFRTPIAKIGMQEVFVNVDYRYWKEIDPSDAIKSADIDEFDYITLSISSSNGVYVSYSDGKLPFDLKDQQVYEIGWKFHFN